MENTMSYGDKDNRERYATDHAALSTGENDILRHWSRWGSDGYPIRKMGRHWHWVESFGVKGAPVVYKTKRQAVAAFERYVAILIERSAGRL